MFPVFQLLSLLSGFGSDAPTLENRPNVVLIMADDQGWGETGYNGHPLVRTPVLDEMAAKGLRFDRFYSQHVNCSPTRTSILTGRHPNRSGVFAPNYSTRPEEITIASILKSGGYRTGHFGKWHVGAVKQDSPTNPRRMGFDESLSHDNFFEMSPPLSRNGADPVVHPGESSQVVVEAAVDFIRQVVSEKKPFLTVVWFGSCHAPYSGLEDDVALYREVRDEPTRNRLAEITAMDRAIGSLRKSLRELGVAEGTLVWYCSDNGIGHDPALSFNGGWRAKKGSIYEGGLRVPAIVEWPAVVKEGRRVAAPCVTTDIFKTVLEITGLKSPDPSRPLDGISLKPVIFGEAGKERSQPIGFWKYPAQGEQKNGRWMAPELTRGTTPTTRQSNIDFLNFRHPVAKTSDFGGEAAWTDNQYKLVVGEKGKTAREELYDLLADPREEHDIASQHPDVVRRMRGELENWQRSVERSLSGADYPTTAR